MVTAKKAAQLMASAGLSLLFTAFIVACGPAISPTESLENETTAEVNQSDGETAGESDNIPTAMPAENQPSEVENKNVSFDNGLEIDPSAAETGAGGLPVGFTTDGHPYRGNPEAPIVIEEYSDYQCPYCARFYQETLPVLIEEHLAGGSVVMVFYDFPLNNIHPQAAAAANAARCAGDQGAAAYWAMHDALFGNPQKWSNANANESFLDFAGEMKLDLSQFEECLSSSKFHGEVEADLVGGVSLGVSGTPSFFINDQLLVGAQPIDVFNNAIATISEGGQLASNEPEPALAPTPAVFTVDFAGALGDPDAPVKIVEFTDFQCPYCSRHSLETLPAIVDEMIETGRVYYVLKDMPLDQLHPNARAAAAAARCGGDQGAYWELHDAIFANQTEWSGATDKLNELFTTYAGDAGLDEDLYLECLESGRHDDAVAANLSEGTALGVSGTPFFFVDGYPLNGARPFEHFQIAVQYAEEGRLAEVFAPQPSQPEPQQPSGPVDVPTDNAFAIGDDEAPITIVEYTDFQCPFCSRHFEQTYPRIIEEFVESGKVRYVFKDFPLNSIHPQAAKAAEAARCAGDQQAYAEMHDLLFNRQQQWSGNDPIALFEGYAEELNLDVGPFNQCLTGGKYAAAVEADLQEGIAFGVSGTPHFFINGYPISGAQPFELFEQAITELLAEVEG